METKTPRARVIDNSQVPPPTLVKVYKLTYPGNTLVQQFYRWTFTQEAESFRVPDCPGCGKDLKYSGHHHRCAGTKLANPVDARMYSITGIDEQQQLEDYIKNANHPVIVSDS